METIAYKKIEFNGTLIKAVPDDDGGYGYEIEIYDPWGDLHDWKESDETYPTQEAALEAGKKYVDNYEPDTSCYTESISFREQMAEYQKFK